MHAAAPTWRLSALACLAGLGCAADDYTFGHTGFGAWVVPVPLDQQAAQDLEPGQGALVVGVRPGGTASSLGLEPGDVLLSLDGTDVANRQGIRSVLQAVQPGDAAQAIVQQSDGSVIEDNGTFMARRPRPQGWNPPTQPDPPAQDGAAQPQPAPAPPRGPWNQDPHDTVAGQRADLLAEQNALTSAQQVIDALIARLSLNDGAGAWRLDLHIDSPTTAGANALLDGQAHASAPPSPAQPEVAGAGWSLRLDIAATAP